MSVQFTKVRLSGFKSFVEPTELLIHPGLTGVVGPNGCGKSNLLEALRWAMGEGSAKQMRGGEMDDVIFGGTSDRPARNVAEVMIHLDNSRRAAPGTWNDHDELEIVRRIERGAGSSYRINGKEVRARDVSLLFADLSSGARSAAIVSQGRVGALISAKPQQRRVLLEEAAGITGLHSRRHEAELRLRAAENNLARLEDIIGALDSQLQGLKRQARQASRYRSLSERIRTAEAALLHLRWVSTNEALEAARAALKEAEDAVNTSAREAATASKEQAEAAAGMPELRNEEAAAAAELQRLVVARESLDAEEARIESAQRQLATQIEQIEADARREERLVDEAADAFARLDREAAEIAEAQTNEGASEDELRQAAETATAEAEAKEAEVTALTEQLAAADARRANAERRVAEVEERRARVAERLEHGEAQRAELYEADGDEAALAKAEAEVERAQAALDEARAEAEAAEERKAATTEALEAARSAFQAVEAEHSRLRAEEQGLAALLAGDAGDGFAPAIEAIQVEPGWEAALGAALGDDLDAALEDAAPRHWSVLPPLEGAPALPAGAEPLSRFVGAPEALARRLSQVGVVAGASAGTDMAARLAPGQRLVTREGDLWRWDGLVARAGASDPAAVKLEQRNRLDEIRARLGEAGERLEAARETHETAKAAAEEAARGEKTLAESARQAYRNFDAARDTHAEAAQDAAQTASRREALEESVGRLEADLAELDAELEEARAALAEQPDTGAERARLSGLRESLAAARATMMERRQAYDRLVSESARRRDRLEAIEREKTAWSERTSGGEGQLAQLSARRDQVQEELARLDARPKEIASQRNDLLDRIAGAEAQRKRAGDSLAAAEQRLADVERTLKAAESRLADAREERGRREGQLRQAEQAVENVGERIAERLDASPGQVFEIAGFKEGEALPDLETLEARLERLLRERETMGPVNLRAEQEAEELVKQIEGMRTEREDLIGAIGRLRQGISELNREGRERLLASFEEVNKHFEDLFARLFGGGRAHLKLVESDDPLEAGLEIMASPPGKRLQVLSLLSGGEQALTAQALLFAVFLTNPAPICVLDEVDAPLDDANVERLCDLISDIAREADTRFLLITHHRYTMARMDRLFGVTMPERGVSQLVSVDLQEAEALREAS